MPTWGRNGSETEFKIVQAKNPSKNEITGILGTDLGCPWGLKGPKAQEAQKTDFLVFYGEEIYIHMAARRLFSTHTHY